MSKISIEEKINSVVRKRNEATILVRNSLMENCNKMISSINNLIDSNKDNSKLVKALEKEKELIHSLAEEILFATTSDDIKKIRTKLNYYITKIRKELETRNISNELTNSNNELVSSIRDDIKEYVRCINRKSNIDNILNMYHKDLNKEEKKTINHELAKERKFNNRILSKYNSSESEEIEVEEQIEETKDEEVQVEKEVFVPVEIEIVESEEVKSPFEPVEIEIVTEQNDNEEFEMIDIDAETGLVVPGEREVIYINSKMISNINRYVLSNVERYGDKTFSNVKKFFINIPAYLHNKRIVKLMKSDYANYYSGKDLRELIAITEDNNSFSKALESIIRNSKLVRRIDPKQQEFAKEQEERYQLIDILEEYKRHTVEGRIESDFDFDTIRTYQKVEPRPAVLEGGIEFAPLAPKRLSMR